MNQTDEPDRWCLCELEETFDVSSKIPLCSTEKHESESNTIQHNLQFKAYKHCRCLNQLIQSSNKKYLSTGHLILMLKYSSLYRYGHLMASEHVTFIVTSLILIPLCLMPVWTVSPLKGEAVPAVISSLKDKLKRHYPRKHHPSLTAINLSGCGIRKCE